MRTYHGWFLVTKSKVPDLKEETGKVRKEHRVSQCMHLRFLSIISCSGLLTFIEILTLWNSKSSLQKLLVSSTLSLCI